MFRIMGCVLIFISCSSLGFLKASSYKARTLELESILEMIKLLDMEITYRRDSLAKAFEKVSYMKGCWFSEVLKACSAMMGTNTMEQSWQLALEENMDKCPLKEKDIEVLRDFSMGLGKSDIKGQKNYLEPAMLRIEASLAEARAQEQSQSRMYRGLGIAAGVVIAVILI